VAGWNGVCNVASRAGAIVGPALGGAAMGAWPHGSVVVMTATGAAGAVAVAAQSPAARPARRR